MIRLDFFSSILIVLLITLSVKMVGLFSKIQDQTKYSFVTHASSSLIDTAYAKDDVVKEIATEEPQQDDKALHAAPQQELKAQELSTNLPNMQNGYSKDEIKVLQELSNRRQALEKTEESLNMRENVLKATENKLDQKVSELKSLQNQVSELMKGYDEKENIKYLSLVKIYENMKPREAAKIFDELDMSMLVAIVTRMKEVRSAPIIASMNPSKAKELSIELTKHQSLEQ
jgi:flagellar motility protein MotE (MotC chaperone)